MKGRTWRAASGLLTAAFAASLLPASIPPAKAAPNPNVPLPIVFVPGTGATALGLPAGQEVQFVDGRIPHSVLLEIFTDAGVGTEVVL